MAFSQLETAFAAARRPIFIAAAMVGFIAAAQGARAEVLTYALTGATVGTTGFNCGGCIGSLDLTGQFQYDTILNQVILAGITVQGSIAESADPTLSAGVYLGVVSNTYQDGSNIMVSSSDGNYTLAFEFANPLSNNASDPILQTPYIDGGASSAILIDQNITAGDIYYHIGYAPVTGSADPVPEPGSIALLGVGIVLMGRLRRPTRA